MAHLIDNSKGFNAFISFAKPGWHGLGQVFTEPLNVEQAIQRAGLDFDVLKLPNIHFLPNGEEIISDSSFFTVRTDVNKVLGDRLGKDYTVLQNTETFNLVDEILAQGTASIETAGSIDEGKKVFVCLKLNKDILVNGNDTVNQYMLFANSHDGSMSITATPTNIRVVCNNTLSAALRSASGAIKIRHTSNAAARMQEAAKVLKLIAHNESVNTDTYNIMRETDISTKTFMAYIGNLFFTPEEVGKMQAGTQMTEAIGTQKMNLIKDLSLYANNGAGQQMAISANGSLNMWYAYNAVTGYLTRKKYKTADARANSMLFGGTAAIIEKAGVLAIAPEKIKPLHRIIQTDDLNLN